MVIGQNELLPEEEEMVKTKVFVLYGGKSGEHDVSVSSALNVLNELNRDSYKVFGLYITRDGKWTKPWLVNDEVVSEKEMMQSSILSQTQSILEFLLSGIDEKSIVFPVMHGTYGEDGKVQGLLDMLNLPYVGNGVGASAVAMDKILSKKLFSYHGIPQATFVAFTHEQFINNSHACLKEVSTLIGLPCYVKPSNMGSSIGISHCRSKDDLETAILEAFRFDQKVIIEEEIEGKEVLVALTGNQSIRCSMPGEWKREATFFSYEDKYMDAALTPLIPADIPDETYLKMCEYAKTAYQALGCSGLLRADFFITAQQEIYLNEVNTMPGFTKHSMFPLLNQTSMNCTYSELLDQLISLGFSQYEQKNQIQYQGVTI